MPIIIDTTHDGDTLVRRATLDSDADTYTLEEDSGSGLEVVETRTLTAAERARFAPPPPTDAERLAAVEPLAAAARIASRLSVAPALAAEELEPEDAAALAVLFEPWSPDAVAYPVDRIVTRPG